MNSKQTSVNHRFITYRSDEINCMAVACEYTPRPIDICSFCCFRFLTASLSGTQLPTSALRFDELASRNLNAWLRIIRVLFFLKCYCNGVKN